MDDMVAWLQNTDNVSRQIFDSLSSGRLKRILRRLDAHRYRLLRRRWFNITSDHRQSAPFLTENQLRYYHHCGITMGVHGTSHRIWSGLSLSQLSTEIEDAMAWLTTLGVKQLQGLCLPHGGHSSLLQHWRDFTVLGVDRSYDNCAVIRRTWFKQGDTIDNII
ncbi:MAG: hypothetical protein ACI8WB_005723 [Phenylobacterium sp.]